MENAEPRGSSWSYHHRSESSIQFSQSDKFFCELLEKESEEHINTNQNPSFRVYYGGSKGSVPFLWEMAPGTPKHALSLDNDHVTTVVPPLTPPPRYFNYGSGRETVKRGPWKVLEELMRRIKLTKTRISRFKSLSEYQWSSVMERKGLQNWQSMSVVRFRTPVGKGLEGILNKMSSFGGRCFHSCAE